MLTLTSKAKTVFTDSGGLQKEAYWLIAPCVTLRDETEWTETLATGCNVLAGSDTSRILEAAQMVRVPGNQMLYGDGTTAQRIVDILTSNLLNAAKFVGGWRWDCRAAGILVRTS